jgi:sulfur carrier protein ThiS
MLTIKVNGREQKLSIGCRTCAKLEVVLRILEVDVRQVTLNGTLVSSKAFENTIVQSGDILLLKAQ